MSLAFRQTGPSTGFSLLEQQGNVRVIDVDMSSVAGAPSTDPAMPPPLARRFEAIVFDWDGTAVRDRRADATRMRRLVEEACAAGLELAVVSRRTWATSTVSWPHVRPVPDVWCWRSTAARRCSASIVDGPQLVYRRTASAEEDAALSRAAQLTRRAVGGAGARRSDRV